MAKLRLITLMTGIPSPGNCQEKGGEERDVLSGEKRKGKGLEEQRGGERW